VGFFLGESMKKVLLLLVLGLCFGNSAQAYIRLEPYIGYEMLNGTNPAISFKASGINAGARAGWLSEAERWWIVLDYETTFDGSITFGEADSSKYVKSITALVFGMNFIERPFRIWAGYGMDEWTVKDTSATVLKGNAMKLGIGYTKYKPVSINFEYFSESFNDVSDSSGTTGDPETKSTSYMLSVSWPMKF
jgi:hypothetical protein